MSGQSTGANASSPVVQVEDLHRHYALPREKLFRPPGKVYAVHGVDFVIKAGHSFGVVGESGCGKSTLARTVMALEAPTSGNVRVLGRDLFSLGHKALRRTRRHFQMVFQDPYGSLDPRHTVARIVSEPLIALEDKRRSEVRQYTIDALQSVGLKAGDLDKYPHEFSGGQRQRIAIARALITHPELIVADEPVSALDVSVQAQVLNLMQDLQDRLGLTYMLISHDLAVVEYVCHEVAVMYLGRIVEQGPTRELFTNPAHPYTQALLDAVPQPVPGRRRDRVRLRGSVANQTALALGCPFADRCPKVEAGCRQEMPVLAEIAPGHLAACHLV